VTARADETEEPAEAAGRAEATAADIEPVVAPDASFTEAVATPVEAAAVDDTAGWTRAAPAANATAAATLPPAITARARRA
jgi:hypothetical protein